LGLDIEIFHSNIEGEVVNKFYAAHDRGVDAALFNPAGFSLGYPALVAAIAQVGFPTIEVHISNTVRPLETCSRDVQAVEFLDYG
jgi:3-dehydroquinate dehydratase II